MNLSIWEGLIIFIKGFVVVMFAMNVAVILTWADRRQGAMIQDRIGPNRAVIWLPTRLAQVAVVAPALAASGLVLWLAFALDPAGATRTTWAIVISQASIFLTWFTGLVVAGKVKKRGPRSSFDLWIRSVGGRNIALIGLSVHAAAFLLGSALRGTEMGVVLRDLGFGGGAALLAFAMVGGAGYAAHAIH